MLRWGIVFSATNVENDPGTGEFIWLQLVDVDQTYLQTGTAGGTPDIIPNGTGLDNRYPAFTGPQAYDAPVVALDNNGRYPILGRTFSARMYLMWHNASDPNAIAVTIGYTQWGFSGDARQMSNHQWQLNTPGSASPIYHKSVPGDPFHGMPTWSKLAANTMPD
jgi:hypothetical protein